MLKLAYLFTCLFWASLWCSHCASVISGYSHKWSAHCIYGSANVCRLCVISVFVRPNVMQHSRWSPSNRLKLPVCLILSMDMCKQLHSMRNRYC